MAKPKKFAGINVPDEFGAQPIHTAAFRGKLGLVKRLVKVGEDVNAKGPGGSTPIHFAVRMSHARVKNADYTGLVRFLIEKGADVNAKNTMGYPPLHFAKNRKVIELLRKAGAKEMNGGKGGIIECDDKPVRVEKAKGTLEEELKNAYCHKCALPELKITKIIQIECRRRCQGFYGKRR